MTIIESKESQAKGGHLAFIRISQYSCRIALGKASNDESEVWQ